MRSKKSSKFMLKESQYKSHNKSKQKSKYNEQHMTVNDYYDNANSVSSRHSREMKSQPTYAILNPNQKI